MIQNDSFHKITVQATDYLISKRHTEAVSPVFAIMFFGQDFRTETGFFSDEEMKDPAVAAFAHEMGRRLEGKEMRVERLIFPKATELFYRFLCKDGSCVARLTCSRVTAFYNACRETNPLRECFTTPEMHLNLYKYSHWVENLDLSKQGLTTLVSEMAMLRFLKYLNLSHNMFTALPEVIFTLTELETLDLRENPLETLPEELQSLKKLSRLDVSYTQITELPEWLGTMERLEVLTADKTKLLRVPEAILENRSLKYLYVRFNRLEIAPSSKRVRISTNL